MVDAPMTYDLFSIRYSLSRCRVITLPVKGSASSGKKQRARATRQFSPRSTAIHASRRSE